MFVRQVGDEQLAQYAYLLGCQRTGEALLVDPERDVDRYVALAEREGLRITAVAETHIHADFLSGARELAARTPGLRVYLSAEGGEQWQYEWPARDGVAATWLRDGDAFRVGLIELRARHTPGHTPEHLSFLVTDRGGGADEPIAMLSGDFVFVGDLGRPDLLESAAGVTGATAAAARQLFHSAKGLRDLSDFLQVWPGHGAGSACGKALGAVPMTTLGYERRHSPALAALREGEQAFTRFILDAQPEPPGYFGRMKTLNRTGPPRLAAGPPPARWSAAEFRALADRPDVQVIDTRVPQQAFFAGHVPGALTAPLDRAFPTVVGSLADPEQPVVLLVDEPDLDDAQRQLARIGVDRVVGWAPLAIMDALRRDAVPLATIASIDFAELERRRARAPLAVLDVRSASEFAAGHIPGARNVAHTRLRMGDTPADLDRPDGVVYVHCASGVRAAAAAAFLARRGHRVVHVDGAFEGWRPA